MNSRMAKMHTTQRNSNKKTFCIWNWVTTRVQMVPHTMWLYWVAKFLLVASVRSSEEIQRVYGQKYSNKHHIFNDEMKKCICYGIYMEPMYEKQLIHSVCNLKNSIFPSITHPVSYIRIKSPRNLINNHITCYIIFNAHIFQYKMYMVHNAFSFEKYYNKYRCAIMSCQKAPKQILIFKTNPKIHEKMNSRTEWETTIATMLSNSSGHYCGKPTQVYSNLFFNA